MIFKLLPLSDLPHIKNGWEQLETGHDMTYFQTYSWYEMLSGIYLTNKFEQEILFCLVYKKNGLKLIAPLIVYKKTNRLINRKGFYFFGRRGWSDYLNLIYDTFDETCADFLFDELKNSMV